MPRLASSILLALAASGCVVNLGTRVQDVGVANSPAGTRVEMRLRKSDLMIQGELLDVRDDALVLLVENRVKIVPFPIIRRARYADAPVVSGDGSRLGPSERDHLRLYSRYPNGMSSGVMAQLLRALDQDAPDFPTE